MDQAESTRLIGVEKVAVDHIHVSGPKPGVVQGLLALTPLLTVMITAIGIVFTLCFQIYQTCDRPPPPPGNHCFA